MTKQESHDFRRGSVNSNITDQADAIAERYVGQNLPIWVQIFAFGSCVASTFAAHIACTLPNCTMPIDELPHIRVDDLSGGSMDLSNGAITLIEEPGLGVSLDMNAVERYQIR